MLVQEVIARLRELGARDVRELDGVAERIVFPLPKGLAGRPRRRLATRLRVGLKRSAEGRASRSPGVTRAASPAVARPPPLLPRETTRSTAASAANASTVPMAAT